MLTAMEEIFKDIQGWPHYQVSNFGAVRSDKSGDWLPMKPNVGKKGYCRVNLSNGRKDHKSYAIHRLVYEAFVGVIPEGMEIDHINAVRDDNRLENLRVVTHKENTNNPITLKRRSECAKGERNPMFGRKHTDEAKRAISQKNTGRHHTEESKRKLSEAFSGEKNPMYGKPTYGFKGKHHTEETKRKISEKHRGKKRPCSEEHRRNLSIALKRYFEEKRVKELEKS